MCEKMTFINKKEKEFNFKVLTGHNIAIPEVIAIEIISNKDRTLFQGVCR